MTAPANESRRPTRARSRAGEASIPDVVIAAGQVQHEEIANRAYERFTQRGGEHGHDLEDWLMAERDLMQGLPLEK